MQDNESKIWANRLVLLKQMVSQYQFEKPLDQYLKEIFLTNKKFGSRDRRFYKNIIYNYYRLSNLKLEQVLHIQLAAFLSNEKDFEKFLQSQTHFEIPQDLTPIQVIQKVAPAQKWYPAWDAISRQINMEEWCNYFFTKTKVWVRVEKGNINNFNDYLIKNQIPFIQEKSNVFGFESNINLKDLTTHTKSIITIQDLSSQLAVADIQLFDQMNIWDCCAASGGKSLALYHKNPSINLYVSDQRSSIIENLKRRFHASEIKNYDLGIIDLSKNPGSIIEFQSSNRGNKIQVEHRFFDMLVIDAPCSGSGSWKRSPEQIARVTNDTINSYQTIQKQICTEALPFLKTGGRLIYMTCSLYQNENEQIANYLVEEKKLELIDMKYYNCSEKGGDSIFKAEFVKK